VEARGELWAQNLFEFKLFVYEGDARTSCKIRGDGGNIEERT
jgi:hypothetical protein